MINKKDNSIQSQLREKLIEQIHKCTSNERFPSERELAKKHQVCRATINKVIVDLERSGYLTRFQGKGTFVSPRDKLVLQETNSADVKGDLLIAYADYFSYPVWESVHLAEMAALKSNLNLVNFKLQRESKLESIFEAIDKCHNLQGIILMTSINSVPILDKLNQLKIPVIFLQNYATGNSSPVYNFKYIYEVTSNHQQSGYLKMDLLLKNGHREIGYIRNQPRSLVTQNSLTGAKQALTDHGLRHKDLMISQPAIPWSDAQMAGYQKTIDLLKKHDLTALLYDTQLGCIGGLRALYELGLKCPENISMIASCPSLTNKIMTCPDITTVYPCNEDLIKVVMDIIVEPEKIYSRKFFLGVKLAEGESVKKLNILAGKI